MTSKPMCEICCDNVDRTWCNSHCFDANCKHDVCYKCFKEIHAMPIDQQRCPFCRRIIHHWLCWFFCEARCFGPDQGF